jgi:hypothetical protein
MSDDARRYSRFTEWLGEHSPVICMMVGLAACGLWFIVAVFYTGNNADGQRGGAIAVMMTFVMIMVDFGKAWDEYTMKPADPNAIMDDIEALSAKHGGDALKRAAVRMQLASTERDRQVEHYAVRAYSALGVLLAWATEQKWPLLITSLVGTFVWGFGDMPVTALHHYVVCSGHAFPNAAPPTPPCK